jgi:Spy/CpxP family protein refolding chaperone
VTPANKNPKVLSTLVFVFLAGVATGALFMRVGLHEKLHRSVAAANRPVPQAPSADPASDPLLQRFKKQLDLTDEQSKAVAGVLSDYRHYYRSVQEQLEDIRSTGREQIMDVLTPEQRRKFEQISSDLPAPSPAK